MELTPIFRIEKFLDAIINNTTPPEPVFRVEYFLAKIGGADVVTPEPLFRIEKYLAKILGEDVEIPEPMFRTEFWLAKKCGEDVETPDPAFRVEYWLEEWTGGSSDPLTTFTGRIIRFLAKNALPIVKIEANFTPIQSGTGDPSPTNIRPISGHTGATVVQTGEEHLSEDKAVWGQYGTNESGYTNNPSRFSPYNFTIPFETGKTYTITAFNFMGNGKSFYCGVGEWDSSNTRIVDHGWQELPYTFTVNSSTATIRIAFRDNSWGNCAAYVDAIGTSLFITMNESAPNTVSISFGQTVYGGQLTVFEDGSGQVVADRAKKLFDGTETITVSRTSATQSYAMFSLGTKGTHVSASGISNMLKPVTSGINTADWSQMVQNSSAYNRDQIAFRFDNSFDGGDNATTLANYKAELVRLYNADTPLEVVYQLVNPITIPLTPGQINTLVGENVVWVNDATGDITVQAYGTAIT